MIRNEECQAKYRALPDVCLWPKADIAVAPRDVPYWG
jgi:hypothetical protein